MRAIRDVSALKHYYKYHAKTNILIELDTGKAVRNDGQIKWRGQWLAASRLAYCLQYGIAPVHPIRFIDGNKCNLRADNLSLNYPNPFDQLDLSLGE